MKILSILAKIFWKKKTRVGLKCFMNDCGCPHMDMDGSRPVAASSRYILVDCGWFWAVMVCLGCLQMVFRGFRWFSEICNFSSYGEIRCFKFKTSRQLWEVFVAPSNNDAKVPLKQMSKFLGNSKFKVSLKKSLGGYKKFFLWKLTYIALCKFSRFWLRFSSFWGNFFKVLFICLIIGWQFCILGRVFFGHFQKVIIFALETSGKKPNFHLSKNHEHAFL